MAERVDVAVVGGGLMGAAAAWAAARRGLSVALHEQFEPGHTRGSSHGSARIVRRGYSDALYTRLSGEAFEMWREVELRAEIRLLRMVGGVDHGPNRTALVASLLAAAGIRHEVLAAPDAQERWPGMHFTGPVVYHPQAGTMDADRAVAALLDLARRDGATTEHGSRVAAVEAVRDEYAAVRLADGREFEAQCAIVAAGAWVAPFLGGSLRLPPLTVTQQQVFHFPRRDEAAAPWPSAIHQDAMEVYHLPGGRDGGSGDARKVAEHTHRNVTTAETRDGVVDAGARDRIVRYVTDWLPGLEPIPQGETTCLYTSTPSEDFLLDRVGPILICSPCSGHGAKFAPLIGELVAGLLTGDRPVPDRFRLGAHTSMSAVAKVSL